MFDFKGFVQSLLRKQVESGTVTDLKTATQFMQELGGADILRALTEVTRALAELNRNTSIGVKERVRTVLYLDEKAQLLQDQLTAEWLSKVGDVQQGNRQILPSLAAYALQQQLAFKTCLRGYAKSPSRSLEDAIKLVTARAMMAYGRDAVLALVRYIPVEDRIWRNLHRLYSFAETEQFAQAKIQIYPGNDRLFSCMNLYLRLAMLHLSQADRLPAHHIIKLDEWLARQLDTMTLERQIRPHRQAYVVDLGVDSGPKRLRRTMIGEGLRYWSTDTLVEIVEQTMQRLTEGSNPVELGFGEGIRTQECLTLLNGLNQRWSREADPMLRRYERQPTQKSVTVAQGLKDVIHHLRLGVGAKPVANGKPVDLHVSGPGTLAHSSSDALFESHLEEWLVENQSVTGVGATFNPSYTHELRVGTLVGLREDGAGNCALGVVRRLQNSGDGHAYAGIETLSQRPLVVELGEEGDSDSKIDGLYIPEITESKTPRSLIVPADTFRPGKIMRLAAQGKAYMIRLWPASEETGDFARTNFDVVGRG